MTDAAPRFAIVTGASSGIGAAIRARLRAQGEDVLGIDREAAEGVSAVDLARADAGEAVLAAAGGRDPDILVNAAAVFHSGDLISADAGTWDRLYAVNLRAPALLVRALAPGLGRRRGLVVNISSVNAIRNAPGNAIYDSLKAGLDHLTRGLALELAATGVRVNAVAPGGTKTPGLDRWLQQAAHINDPPDPARLAQPDEIARIVTFLLGPDSHWINGTVILADNGAHLGI